MFSHQSKFWEIPNFCKVLVGGYGSGKTLIGAKWIVSMALENAPCLVAAVSPTYKVARKTTIQSIRELLEGKQRIYGRRKFWWSFNKNEHEFTIRFHGRVASITVYSGENPLSLRGPNLAAAWIDEPFIQDEEVFYQMLARIRHPQAKELALALTGTPEQLNWGYDLCVGELEEEIDVGFVRASTRENIALSPDYVARLEGAYSEKMARAFIEGHFVNLSEGQVFYSFDPLENVARIRRPEGAKLGAGMDFNVNPMASTVYWQNGNHIHFFYEKEMPNADTELMCQHLRAKFWKQGLRDIIPDASGNRRQTNAPGGKSDFHYIRQAGFKVNAPSKNPLIRDRYNAVNGKLKPRRGRITLTIDPSCKKLIKYLSIYSHELKHKQEAQSHLIDSFSYPIARLFPVDKEVFGIYRFRGA
jgi:hypothetical protein